MKALMKTTKSAKPAEVEKKWHLIDADGLVVGRLASIVANILAPCHSLYRWEGRIEEAAEIPVLLKTRADLAECLIERIDSLHSYEVPAAVAWVIEAAIPAYARWVEAETRSEPSREDVTA